MKPSIGRIVHYGLGAGDVARIHKRREDFQRYRVSADYQDTGYVAHYGQPPLTGETLPLMITRVWDDGSISGQVILDGSDTLWVNMVPEGEGPGTWSWPPRV